MRSRVLLAEDHTAVAEGVTRILESDFEVLGPIADGGTDQSETPERQNHFSDDALGSELFAACNSHGSLGLSPQDLHEQELINAIREVLAGRMYISADIAGAFHELQRVASSKHRTPQELTPRQTEILRLVAMGRSDDEIAADLQITSRTVKFHRSQISRKLGVRGTAGLTRCAISRGIVGH